MQSLNTLEQPSANMMRIIIVAFIIALFLPMTASAVTFGGLEDTKNAAGISSVPVSPNAVAGKVLGQILSYVGVLFLGLMLYAGVLWMTAGGNEDAATKAKEIILAAVIGLIIVAAAYAITRFIGDSIINGNPSV